MGTTTTTTTTTSKTTTTTETTPNKSEMMSCKPEPPVLVPISSTCKILTVKWNIWPGWKEGNFKLYKTEDESKWNSKEKINDFFIKLERYLIDDRIIWTLAHEDHRFIATGSAACPSDLINWRVISSQISVGNDFLGAANVNYKYNDDEDNLSVNKVTSTENRCKQLVLNWSHRFSVKL